MADKRWLAQYDSDVRPSLQPYPDKTLLDYLAAEFRDGKQSLKDLHRSMLLSSVYRQASQRSEVGGQTSEVSKEESTDAENRYLWRMSRPRVRSGS